MAGGAGGSANLSLKQKDRVVFCTFVLLLLTIS